MIGMAATCAGCYILRPYAHQIWDSIHRWFDERIAVLGVENCYFPLLITKQALETEASHVEGFAAEVRYVSTRKARARQRSIVSLIGEPQLPAAHHKAGAGEFNSAASANSATRQEGRKWSASDSV